MPVQERTHQPPAPFDLAELVPKAALDGWQSQAPDWDRANSYPDAAVKELAALGALGATFPRDLGGRGATLRQVIELARIVAWRAPVLARVVVDANLGPTAMIIELAGSEVQREVLASIRAGNKPAIAITEADAGSDVGSIQTSLTLSDGVRSLNGSKRWITGAPLSTHYVVFARYNSDATGTNAIGIVLARSGHPGIECLPGPEMMGMRGLPEGGLEFADYRVAAGDTLAEPPHAFAVGMSLYNGQRLGAAMIAAAIAERALFLAIERARSRRQFGRPLIDNQGLSWQLVEFATEVAHTLTFIRSLADQAEGLRLPRAPVAMAKLRAAGIAHKVTSGALQVFGAEGYSRRAPLERLLRDVRMFSIAGGTSEMLREALGQVVRDDKLWAGWPFGPAPER